MQRGSSSLTPIFFFSSIRPGSGKSSIVSNLSVYLNSLKHKVAVLDFDHISPQKLRGSYPESYEIQGYSQITSIANNEAPRFQQNFYFSDTNLVSFFPCHNIKDVSLMMADAALRDFFLQLTNSFDFVLINLPSGTAESQKVSDLLTKAYLWRACKPSSIIISIADENSLTQLDKFIQGNQQIGYQAEESTYFFFNKVPNSAEEQSYNDTLLNISEVRKLFAYPLTYVIPHIEDFLEQRNSLNHYVLDKNSLINQYIAGIYRILTGSASLSYLLREANSYQSCISGSLFSKIYPYIEELQKKAAARLFVPPSDIQIFLEQNEQNFRIRLRLTSIGQKLLGIRRDIPEYKELTKIKTDYPTSFGTKNLIDSFRTIEIKDRETSYSLSFKSIFTFDDSFYSNPINSISKTLPLLPQKQLSPSPIIFHQRSVIPEIPSLSNILGLVRKQQFLSFGNKADEINQHGVSPFYVPTEFHLSFGLDTKFRTKYFLDMNNCPFSPSLEPSSPIKKSYQFNQCELEKHSIYDIFSRGKTFQFESDFDLRTSSFSYFIGGIEMMPIGIFSLIKESLPNKYGDLIEPEEYISPISNISFSKYKINKEALSIRPSDSLWLCGAKSPISSPESYEQSIIECPSPQLYYPDLKVSNFIHNNSIFEITKHITNSKLIFCGNLESIGENKVVKNTTYYHLDFSEEIFKTKFRDKKAKPLPKASTLEDVMLDYHYSMVPFGNQSQWGFVLDDEKTKKAKYKPELMKRFEHKYMEPDLLIRRRATYKKPIMYQLFYLRRLAISAKVLITNADYKVAYNEIFPVIYLPKPSDIYLTRNFAQPVLPEITRKDSLKQEQLKIHIPPIRVSKEEKVSYDLNIPSGKKHFSKIFYIDLSEPRMRLLITAHIKPDFSDDYLKFPSLPLINTDKTGKLSFQNEVSLNKSDYKNIIPELNAEFDSVNIFTERMRSRTEKFYSYGCENKKSEILGFNADIYSQAPLKIQSFIHHKNRSIGENKKLRQKSYPILVKSLKLINNFTDLKDKKRNLNFNFFLDQDLYIYKDSNSKLDNLFVKKDCTLEYIEPKLVRKYILNKLAVKLPVPRFGPCLFYVEPEKPSDTLYKHLLWQVSNSVNPIKLEFKNKSEKIRLFTRAMVSTLPYESDIKLENIEFIIHDDVTKKFNRSLPRKAYIVKTNYLKDLLALAKAQSSSLAKELFSLEK